MKIANRAGPFAVLAAGILLGPIALFWSRRETPQP